MSGTTVQPGQTVWNLPPLILHPFNENVTPAALLENSQAALMLSGLIPEDGTGSGELQRKVMLGRYAEVRMLYYLGKDVCRWLDQCLECAGRDAGMRESGIRRQSFAALLTASPPENVNEKLMNWGVADYRAIFARAIGLNALFQEPPAYSSIAVEFLRNYHRYADSLFRCYMDSEDYLKLEAARFPFELYASGEYSRLLESEWQTE
jgi:hypothetical protein